MDLRMGVEKPLLYNTPPTKVNRATIFLTFLASQISPESSLVDKNFVMSNAYSRASVLTS